MQKVENIKNNSEDSQFEIKLTSDQRIFLNSLLPLGYSFQLSEITIKR
jgi:hypothetical protein